MRCFQSSVPSHTRLHVIFSSAVCGQEETSDFLEQTNLFEHTLLNFAYGIRPTEVSVITNDYPIPVKDLCQ